MKWWISGLLLLAVAVLAFCWQPDAAHVDKSDDRTAATDLPSAVLLGHAADALSEHGTKPRAVSAPERAALFGQLVDDDEFVQVDALLAVKALLLAGRLDRTATVVLLLDGVFEGRPLSKSTQTTLYHFVGQQRDGFSGFASVALGQAHDADATVRMRALRFLNSIGPMSKRHISDVTSLLRAHPLDGDVCSLVSRICRGDAWAPIAPQLIRWHLAGPDVTQAKRQEWMSESLTTSDGYLKSLRDWREHVFRAVTAERDSINGQRWWKSDLEDPRAALVRMFIDADDAQLAVRTLREGGDSVVQCLCKSIADNDYWTSTTPVLEALHALIETRSPAVAAWALRALPSDSPRAVFTGMLGHADPRIQRAAASRLSDLGVESEATVAALRAMLRSGDDDSAWAAATALANAGKAGLNAVPDALRAARTAYIPPWFLSSMANFDPQILTQAMRDKHDSVRRLVHHALTFLPQITPNQRARLADSLRDDDLYVRLYAAEMLAQSSDPLVNDALAAGLQATDRHVLGLVLRIMTRRGPAARPLLRDLLAMNARVEAVEWSWRKAACVHAIVGQDFALIGSWLHDESSRALAQSVLWELAQSDSSYQPTIDFLIRTVSGDEPDQVRIPAATVLNWRGGTQARAALAKAMDDPAPGVRLIGARIHSDGKGAIGVKARKTLAALLDTSDPEVTGHAASLLAHQLRRSNVDRAIQQDVFEALRAHIDHPHEKTRLLIRGIVRHVRLYPRTD